MTQEEKIAALSAIVRCLVGDLYIHGFINRAGFLAHRERLAEILGETDDEEIETSLPM